MITESKHELIRKIARCLAIGNKPIIHPNGFIQLKTEEGDRLHFWHPKIPRQKVSTPIHDHTFDMESKVIAGSIIHTEVWIQRNDNGYYRVYQANPVRDAETTLEATGERVVANYSASKTFKAGDGYFFPAFSFHVTRDDCAAVTIISKKHDYPGNPRVLVPFGEEPDNSWTRDEFETFAIMGMIDTVLNQAFAD